MLDIVVAVPSPSNISNINNYVNNINNSNIPAGVPELEQTHAHTHNPPQPKKGKNISSSAAYQQYHRHKLFLLPRSCTVVSVFCRVTGLLFSPTTPTNKRTVEDEEDTNYCKGYNLFLLRWPLLVHKNPTRTDLLLLCYYKYNDRMWLFSA